MVRHTVLAAMLISPCGAGLLVHEPFDYPQGVLTGLGGGSGWSGPWTQDGESCVITPGPLAYVDGENNSLLVSGSIADTTGADTTRNFRTVAGGPLSDVWISFLFRLPSSNNLYEGVNFYLGATSLFAVSNGSGSAGPGIVLNNFVTGAHAVTGAGVFGQTHFIVLHLTEGGGTGGGDRVELFVDPPLAGPDAGPDGVISAGNLDFDRVRLAGQSGATLEVDELRIGDSFADVAPYEAVPDTDPDDDGLTNSQELELGLDPNVSDAELILAIRRNPGFFGLYDDQGIQDLAGGGVVVEGRDGVADLTFEIQQTPDLFGWSHFETIHRSIPLLPGKGFLRLNLDPILP
jgi:hypothetical protein